MGDPVILSIVVAATIVIVLSIAGRSWRLLRGYRRPARNADVRAVQRTLEAQRERLEQLALQIVTTSSTATIAGYEVVRQIEAVFTEGHPTPSAAVTALKAQAAQRGANAIVNLATVRPPTGKCMAQGDAVVVRPNPDGGHDPEPRSPGGKSISKTGKRASAEEPLPPLPHPPTSGESSSSAEPRT